MGVTASWPFLQDAEWSTGRLGTEIRCMAAGDVPKVIIMATVIPVATFALIGCAVLLILHRRNKRRLVRTSAHACH